MSRTISLRARFVVLFLLADLALIVLFAGSVFLYLQRRMLRSFDATLLANASALASRVELDGGELEFEYTGPPTATAGDTHFIIWGPQGETLGRSPAPFLMPIWCLAGAAEGTVIEDIAGNPVPLRAILLATHARSEQPVTEPVPIKVLYAAPRTDLDRELASAALFLALAGGALLLLSWPAAWLIAGRGLVSLDQLARETHAIHAGALQQRVETAAMPTDLQPLAVALNGLLDRPQRAFDDERRFAADAAHELRTPVAIMKSGVQATLLAPPSLEDDRATLLSLLEDIERLEVLCEDLLLAGTVNVTELPTGVISGAEFLVQVSNLVSIVEARDTAKRVQVDVQEPLPAALRADGIAVRSILGNLLDNALRHGGSAIDIRLELVECLGNGLRVIVHDNGPGVDGELEPRLFQRFARGDASRSRGTGGVGLGLAISRALAERHGGNLTYQRSPSGGAVFCWFVAGADGQVASARAIPRAEAR